MGTTIRLVPEQVVGAHETTTQQLHRAIITSAGLGRLPQPALNPAQLFGQLLSTMGEACPTPHGRTAPGPQVSSDLGHLQKQPKSEEMEATRSQIQSQPPAPGLPSAHSECPLYLFPTLSPSPQTLHWSGKASVSIPLCHLHKVAGQCGQISRPLCTDLTVGRVAQKCLMTLLPHPL